jgi:hypothetical protein
MSTRPTVGRKWAIRLAALLLVGFVSWFVSPALFSFGEKGENLRPELALVPPDAFLFVQLRAGEVWDSDLIVKSRAALKEFAGKMDLPMDPADVESISVVVQSAQAFPMLSQQFGSKPVEKPNRSDKKEIDDFKSGKKVMEDANPLIAERDSGTLDKKNGEVVIVFSKGVPLSIEPTEKDGVAAKIMGYKIFFEQFVEPPEEDKKIEFKVTGKSAFSDKRGVATITITVRKKGQQPEKGTEKPPE